MPVNNKAFILQITPPPKLKHTQRCSCDTHYSRSVVHTRRGPILLTFIVPTAPRELPSFGRLPDGIWVEGGGEEREGVLLFIYVFLCRTRKVFFVFVFLESAGGSRPGAFDGIGRESTRGRKC